MIKFLSQAFIKAKYFSAKFLHGVETVTPANIPSAGAGNPTGIWWGETKIKRGKHLDDILKKAMERMIEEAIELEPGTAAAKAVEIIKPFVETTEQEVSIDWKAVESDLKKVKSLLALWQKQMEYLEEEEILIMMMAN